MTLCRLTILNLGSESCEVVGLCCGEITCDDWVLEVYVTMLVWPNLLTGGVLNGVPSVVVGDCSWSGILSSSSFASSATFGKFIAITIDSPSSNNMSSAASNSFSICVSIIWWMRVVYAVEQVWIWVVFVV